MENISKIELQIIKRIIENQETQYKKTNNYSVQAVDPQIKQLFTKFAQESLNVKEKMMSFFNE